MRAGLVAKFRSNRIALMAALAAAALLGAAAFFIVASGIYITAEPENGTITGNAGIGSDVAASSGKYVQFNPATTNSSPPSSAGYFTLQPVGAWSSLPTDAGCSGQVHRSTWEPRPDNTKRNHIMPDPTAVHASFAARPVGLAKFDNWVLPRVDGQFTGTTDEIFQWAACKWGVSDNMLRAIAVRESTWYEYLSYPSGRCVSNYGCGDFITNATADTLVYCNGLAKYGHDYQLDYGAGLCPETFSIFGIKSWQAPSWGQMPDNQNGTYPFNRTSTAFAADYIGGHLRGCYEGWISWLGGGVSGDIWGCVGSWYSGSWHDQAGNDYVTRVQGELSNLTWLQSSWPTDKPSCSATYGCPGPDPY
jgi:hypothetical protein